MNYEVYHPKVMRKLRQNVMQNDKIFLGDLAPLSERGERGVFRY